MRKTKTIGLWGSVLLWPILCLLHEEGTHFYHNRKKLGDRNKCYIKSWVLFFFFYLSALVPFLVSFFKTVPALDRCEGSRSHCFSPVFVRSLGWTRYELNEGLWSVEKHALQGKISWCFCGIKFHSLLLWDWSRMKLAATCSTAMENIWYIFIVKEVDTGNTRKAERRLLLSFRILSHSLAINCQFNVFCDSIQNQSLIPHGQTLSLISSARFSSIGVQNLNVVDMKTNFYSHFRSHLSNGVG